MHVDFDKVSVATDNAAATDKPATMKTPTHWIAIARSRVETGEEVEIVIDMSEVQVISSQEIGELIQLQLWARQQSRRLVLHSPQPDLLQVFTLTRLDRLIELRRVGVSPNGFAFCGK